MAAPAWAAGAAGVAVVNAVEAVGNGVLLLAVALSHFGFNNDDNMAAEGDAAVGAPTALPPPFPVPGLEYAVAGRAGADSDGAGDGDAPAGQN